MDVQQRIHDMVHNNDVVLFMKGSPDFPQCGFSMRAAGIMRALGVPFHHVDVLQDPDVRQGIKTFSKWPTIPQLYIKASFVGGSDIMMEMWESGELDPLVADLREQAAE